MHKNYLNNKSCKWSTILTKEFSRFFHRNPNNKRMTKLDFLKKFKIKLRSLVLSSKKFPRNKLKGMSICKTQESLTKSSLQIMNLTVFFKIDKPFQAPSLQSSKSLAKKKVGKKLKLMDSFVPKIRRPIKNLTKKSSTKEIGKISETSMKKLKNYLQKSIQSLRWKIRTIDALHSLHIQIA